jgi:hypothetical protein
MVVRLLYDALLFLPVCVHMVDMIGGEARASKWSLRQGKTIRLLTMLTEAEKQLLQVFLLHWNSSEITKCNGLVLLSIVPSGCYLIYRYVE